MIISRASLLPTSCSSFGRATVAASIAAGAPAACAGKHSPVAFMALEVKAALPFQAARSPKICPAPSNAFVLRSIRAAAWPLAMSGGGSRWQSFASSGRGGRGGVGGGRGGRSRTLMPSERRVFERQLKDGSISAENLALLTETLNREKEERHTPLPSAPPPLAPRMIRSEKRVLQARRSKGEISPEDLARYVPGWPLVSVSSVHGLSAFSLVQQCLAFWTMRRCRTLLLKSSADSVLARTSAYALSCTGVPRSQETAPA